MYRSVENSLIGRCQTKSVSPRQNIVYTTQNGQSQRNPNRNRCKICTLKNIMMRMRSYRREREIKMIKT